MTLLRRFLSVALAASLISVAAAQEAKLKIATVDMQELFKQYYRTNEAQKQINVERARIQKDNNERLARIRELETNLGNLKKQIEDPSINDSKKQALFKDWQMQQQEGIALDRERREFLQRRNQALNEKMVQRMKGILEEIRKLVLPATAFGERQAEHGLRGGVMKIGELLHRIQPLRLVVAVAIAVVKCRIIDDRVRS